MRKKLVAGVLAAAMMLTMMPTAAFAAEEIPVSEVAEEVAVNGGSNNEVTPGDETTEDSSNTDSKVEYLDFSKVTLTLNSESYKETVSKPDLEVEPELKEAKVKIHCSTRPGYDTDGDHTEVMTYEEWGKLPDEKWEKKIEKFNLDAGMHYMYAVVYAKGYYPVASNEISFRIECKTHNLKKISQVNATCTKTGTKEYYKCTVCEKLFKDAGGKTSIAAPETISVLNHTWTGKEIVTKPGKNKEGKVVKTCKYCGKKGTSLIIPKKNIEVTAGKTGIIKITKNAGCTFTVSKANKKFIKVNKNGTVKTVVKPKNYKKIPNNIPVKVKVGKKTYTVNVKLVIPAPEVTITPSVISAYGTSYYRYTFNYAVPGATNIKVRMLKGGTQELYDVIDSKIQIPKSTSNSYFHIKKSIIDSMEGGVTFTIVVEYGDNQSKVQKVKVSK